MDTPKEYLEFKNRAQWRNWLQRNHETASEGWLVIARVKYQDLGISLDQAVEEALCFGWIDGTLRSIDEKQYALRFSPRTRTSNWCMRNIRRVEKLIQAGRMTPAGLIKIEEAKANGRWQAAIQREKVDEIPESLERELIKVEGGLAAYEALTMTKKKGYIYWIQTAKRDDTKKRRIKSIIEEILNEQSFTK